MDYGSIALVGVIIIGIYLYYEDKQKKQKQIFEPFWVQVIPRWETLLLDYGLADQREWESLLNDESLKQEHQSLLQNGIKFTLIKSDSESELVYYDDSPSFYSEVDFTKALTFLKPHKVDAVLTTFTPKIYIRSGIEGWELGVITAKSIEKTVIAGDRNNLIKIATIPYSLFSLSRYNYGIEKDEAVKERLQKNGWEFDKDAEEFSRDVLFQVPKKLNHKYFTVEYYYV